MFGCKKAREPHRPHPDPAIELRLRGIAGLARMQAACEAQIALYQEAIASAHAGDAYAMQRLSNGHLDNKRLAAMAVVNAQRRAAAEEGIRQQQEILGSFHARLEAAITEAGLTPGDLLYLDLGVS